MSGCINMPHRRLKSKLAIPRSNTFPPMSHPDKPSSSSGQGVDQHGFSSVPSLTTAYSPNSTHGEALCQQSYVSNYESSSFTNHSQVDVFAGDTSLHTVVEVDSDAATSLERPIVHDILRGVRSGDMTEIAVEPNVISAEENQVDVFAGDTSLHTVVEVDSDAATSLDRPIDHDILRGVRSGDTTEIAVEPNVISAEENQNQHQTNERQTRSDYLFLYRAALKGNWQEAKAILEADQDIIRDSITEARETVLHIASASKHTAFVKELVRFLTEQDLARTNRNGDTALCFAAQLGIVAIAKEMVEKNQGLLLIRNSNGETPLYVAALLGRREMVSYLFSITPFADLDPSERMNILISTIRHDMYDIALKILEKDDNSVAANDMNKIAAFHELAKKPSAIGSTSQLSFWKRCLNSCFKGSCNSALMQSAAHELVERLLMKTQLFSDLLVRNISDSVDSLLFDAAKIGNVEFLVLIIRSYPHIIWKRDNQGRSLFHIAVLNRQESVFNLIHEMVAIKEIILNYVDSEKSNILHLAGQLAPPSRLNILSGAALQMQRELLWFKEVEKIVPPLYLNLKNSKGQTPWDSFIKRHKDLKIEGEKWMRETANFCMIVSTLITTVVFAAAFSVPGGSNQGTGTPILLKNIWFRVFFISDTIAVLSSSSSILIFLSILTSRFTELDFLVSLPSKLVFGLTALFISIVGMVLAFSATCFLVFKTEQVSLPTVLLSAAGVPMILFLRLHFKLWFDIIRSTYLSRFLFSPRQNGLF